MSWISTLNSESEESASCIVTVLHGPRVVLQSILHLRDKYFCCGQKAEGERKSDDNYVENFALLQSYP